MTDQAERADRFRALHVRGDPLVLYNIWDAGGAKALEKAGAKAIATGSWSMAAAHGYKDGEDIPLDLVLQIVARMTATVDLPVSLDFEGGYATDPEQITAHAIRVIRAGAVGVNFEDRVVGGNGLYPIQDQAKRIAAVRRAARHEDIGLFINARTDLFLGTDPATHGDLVSEAIERASAYRDAGGDGVFVPGLTDISLVRALVEAVRLPVNVMMMGDLASVERVAGIGVARASYGPAPYVTAMADLGARFGALADSGSEPP